MVKSPEKHPFFIDKQPDCLDKQPNCIDIELRKSLEMCEKISNFATAKGTKNNYSLRRGTAGTEQPQRMKKNVIQIRDKKLKLFLSLMKQTCWNIPTDFSASIQKEDYELDEVSVARATLRLFPNRGNYIIDDAFDDIVTVAKALRLNVAIHATNGTPYAKISIYISEKM